MLTFFNSNNLIRLKFKRFVTGVRNYIGRFHNFAAEIKKPC